MEICISSNVSNQFIIDDFERYNRIGIFDFFTNEANFFLKEINGIDLDRIEKKMFAIVSELIISIDQTKEVNTHVVFNGNSIGLNFKKDFDLCAKIALYELVKKANELKGMIYLFNREKLKKENAIDLIAYLRFNSGKTIEAILDSKEFNISNSTQAKISLEIELTNLINLGLMDFNKKNKEYVITARGYVFR